MTTLKSVAQVAREFGLSEQTVRRKIGSGEWPALRLGPKSWRLDTNQIRRIARQEAKSESPKPAA
jgi:excisionase family DNA binding protein